MIEIKQLRLQNFLSHKDTILRFDDYNRLVLIEGKNSSGHYSSNGSGKSTLLEGIVYALTGNTLRGVGVNDVVNRNYKKDTCVTLTFHRDEDQYEIQRYRKHKEHKDAILFIKNGEDISQRVNKETQNLIDNTLGISYKVLVSTILLGEGLSSRFTQLSDPDKKSLIESTLSLNYDINALRSKANSRLSELKLLKSNLEGRITALGEYVEFDVEGAEDKLREVTDSRDQILTLIDVKNNAASAANQAYTGCMSKINIIRESLTKVDYIQNQILQTESELFRLNTSLNSVEHSDSPTCPLCHQELSNDVAKESFHNEYTESIRQVEQKLLSLRADLESLPDRSILSNKLESLNKDMQEYKAELDDLVRITRELQTDAYHLNTEIAKLKSDIQNYKEAQDKLESLKLDLSETERQLFMYDYFYKLFSPTGIVVNILSDAIEYINTRLETYSSILLEKDYKINFVKGKISLVDSKGSNYQSLSNGEKRRLDIAIQFSLHDYVTMYCGMKVNTLFVDEILDTLDDVGVENIIDVLKIKLNYCSLKSIFVITHNDALKSKFDQAVTVIKDEKGDSSLA